MTTLYTVYICRKTNCNKIPVKKPALILTEFVVGNTDLNLNFKILRLIQLALLVVWKDNRKFAIWLLIKLIIHYTMDHIIILLGMVGPTHGSYSSTLCIYFGTPTDVDFCQLVRLNMLQSWPCQQWQFQQFKALKLCLIFCHGFNSYIYNRNMVLHNLIKASIPTSATGTWCYIIWSGLQFLHLQQEHGVT